MSEHRPIEVAIVGGGCAGVSAAFELTQPHLRGKYHVTLYQTGWRLGGKGASGRGPADRIEEHGLHLWLGYYENAFRLLRACYAELGREPESCRFADWRDAIFQDPVVSLADNTPDGSWCFWTACFPTNGELPGEQSVGGTPRPLTDYLVRGAQLLGALLASAGGGLSGGDAEPPPPWPPTPTDNPASGSTSELVRGVERILRYGRLAGLGATVAAIRELEIGLAALPVDAHPLLVRLVDAIGLSVRGLLETLLDDDDELRRLWSIADLWLAILRGAVRDGLISDPRGLDAINDLDFRAWLYRNGASRRTLSSTFVRSLYDLAFAYERGDAGRPSIAAGQGLRTLLRMFFTYKGALFWKMRASMGDVVFAPLYEVLRARGVDFRFFHRLETVRLAEPADLAAGERPYVAALEFDVQATIAGAGAYQPLVDIAGLPSWPSQPIWRQLEDGERMRREGWQFESHWDRRATEKRTLHVTEDFDAVILAIGLGAVPHVCGEILQRDRRWRRMVDEIGLVATQAFQLWLHDDMEALVGKGSPANNLSGFVKPFDTWADMRQVLPEETWPPPSPRAIAYFCSVLPTPEGRPDRADEDYPAMMHERVRDNAVRFLNRDVVHIWPYSVRPEGGFRWRLLVDPRGPSAPNVVGEERFRTQFWTANVHPSDLYVLSLPGTQDLRISPLDNTYDNLTVAGDWTDCGYNQGCVEAAVMSGCLAAHAISGWPRLEDIVGYDHP